MSEEKVILVHYDYADSQDTWRNMTPSGFLLFRNTKDAKDYVFKKHKADNWCEEWFDQERIRIWHDRKNRPNDYIMYYIIRREVLTKASITRLLKTSNYC